MSPPLDLDKVARLRRRIIATAVMTTAAAAATGCKKEQPAINQPVTVNEPPAPPTPNTPLVQNITPPAQAPAPILDGDGGQSGRPQQDLNESSPRNVVLPDGGTQEVNDSPPRPQGRTQEQDLNDTPPSPAAAADGGQAMNSARTPHIPGHPTPNTPAQPPRPRNGRIEPPGNG